RASTSTRPATTSMRLRPAFRRSSGSSTADRDRGPGEAFASSVSTAGHILTSAPEGAHRSGHVSLATILEALDRARDVGVRAVLAELPLALDAVDDDLDADDGAELAFDVGPRCVGDGPGLLPGTFMERRQPPDVGLDPSRIVVHYHPAVDLNVV